MTPEVKRFCDVVNRRLMTMSAIVHNELVEFLEDHCLGSNGNLMFNKSDVRDIADILDVNTNCIDDILFEEFNIEL